MFSRLIAAHKQRPCAQCVTAHRARWLSVRPSVYPVVCLPVWLSGSRMRMLCEPRAVHLERKSARLLSRPASGRQASNRFELMGYMELDWLIDWYCLILFGQPDPIQFNSIRVRRIKCERSSASRRIDCVSLCTCKSFLGNKRQLDSIIIILLRPTEENRTKGTPNERRRRRRIQKIFHPPARNKTKPNQAPQNKKSKLLPQNGNLPPKVASNCQASA